MSVREITNLPALCGSVQDLTNPDFCGIGVLASYTAGIIFVFLHQAGFAILDCTSKESNNAHQPSRSVVLGAGSYEHHQHQRASDTRPYQFRASLEASSISLFETAIVLAISWQVAALLTLNSPSSVQTTHDVLLVCLTAYASIGIALGALCTSFDHIRRQTFRIGFSLLSMILCACVTGMAQHQIAKDDFPKEICLPFFNDYKNNMRRYFVVLSVVFWAISIILVAIMCVPLMTTRKLVDDSQTEQSPSRRTRLFKESKLYIVAVVELLLLVIILLVNHHWVPEQVLRAQAGGQLQESQWTFGQIIGMLIWLPVLTEFFYVFFFGPKEGLEGRIPLKYFVDSQSPEVTLGNTTILSRMSRQSVGKGFTRMDTDLQQG